jgi:hypothetical protein
MEEIRNAFRIFVVKSFGYGSSSKIGMTGHKIKMGVRETDYRDRK